MPVFLEGLEDFQFPFDTYSTRSLANEWGFVRRRTDGIWQVLPGDTLFIGAERGPPSLVSIGPPAR